MKKFIPILFFVIIVFTSCNNYGKNKNLANTYYEEVDTVYPDLDDTIESLEDNLNQSSSKSLNEIRFDGWDSEKWLDNEYIRELRAYLDDYSSGKIVNEELDPYKDVVSGKFIIANIEPYMLGGTFIQIIFLDNTSKMFVSWVYSGVDEDKELVTDYEVRYVKVDEQSYDFKKEDILETMKEHPELKAW